MGGITGGGVSQDISGLQGIAGTELGQGQGIYGPAYNQFLAGATGQLTPSQQAAVTQTLNQMNLGTAGRYGNLGLGGSTMEQQDLGANQLSSLAQQQAFETQSETLGLDALKAALGFETGAGTALGYAGQLGTSQQAQQLNALSNAASALGGKGGAAGGGGLLGGLFG